MRQRKHERPRYRQRGQFMTPDILAEKIVRNVPLGGCKRVLEPSCGDGAFLSPLAVRLRDRVRSTASRLLGIEIDPDLAARCRSRMDLSVGPKRSGVSVDICETDFFRAYLLGSVETSLESNVNFHHGSFDLIIGNPPFGGTFDHAIEDILDSRLGRRFGRKIKKETYAFFIVACLDLLKTGGRMVFICSSSLLTISTMMGLRNLLVECGDIRISDLSEFSSETSYPMILLDFVKLGHRGQVHRNGVAIDAAAIQSTPNLSWGITPEIAPMFSGALMGDLFLATSGMTTGRNEYFVRSMSPDRKIVEPFRFEFYEAKSGRTWSWSDQELLDVSDRFEWRSGRVKDV